MYKYRFQNLSDFEVVEELKKHRSYFPNSRAIAEYRPYSQTIHLHDFDAEPLAGIANPDLARKDLEAILHEITHWSDQISTVWGQELLVKTYEVYSVFERHNESDFWKLLKLFDEMRYILEPDYYHVVTKGSRRHSMRHPWDIGYTVGRQFDAHGHLQHGKPMFMVRLYDHQSNALIARQPITVGTLLETNAVWAESVAGMSAIGKLGADESKVERSLMSAERERLLYDETLTAYTAPVHMLATSIGEIDAFEAYQRASMLAGIALNMTEDQFFKLQEPDYLNQIDEGARISLKQLADRGYAFAVLSWHAHSIDRDVSLADWINQVLSRSGLPDYDSMMANAYQRLELISRSAHTSSRYSATRDYLLELGRKRFLSKTTLPAKGELYNPIGTGLTPPMIDALGKVFWMGEAIRADIYDVGALNLHELELRGFMKELIAGCRGV